jgi:two-component system chemotaxis sensor kinase CheA
MNPLLEQFLSESHEFSQGIGEKLMQLENAPHDQDVINELFRLVHTLKGNSGLFTFPEMTRVLHAGEDLLGMVRNGQIAYARELADRLLDAMDLVMEMCADIEKTEKIDASRARDSVRMAEALRALMPPAAAADSAGSGVHSPLSCGTASPAEAVPPGPETASLTMPPLGEVPEARRMEAFRQGHGGNPVYWVAYRPAPECFFQGDDPFFTARRTPGLLWGSARPAESLPPLAELDTYRCSLEFHLLTTAPREEVTEYYRYVPDQVQIVAVDPRWLVDPEGALNGSRIENPALGDSAWNAVALDGGASLAAAETSPQLFEEEAAALERILAAQQQILMFSDRPLWRLGRLKAVAAVLANVAMAMGDAEAASPIDKALAEALESGQCAPLLQQLDVCKDQLAASRSSQSGSTLTPGASPQVESNETVSAAAPEAGPAQPAAVEEVKYGRRADDGIKFGRRAEDSLTPQRSLKVDQAKIDRLMNLIGELVVEKNALPYLAQRAEALYGVRELAREIKGEHSVINRIADEMQDAIMQVRMMAVSFVFQRFPRLVRDTSRKLGKEVRLVLEGDETEADKNIIESLADPLIHIVRNSLDHGLETPEVRRACGKPETGTITIRAAQEGDRVAIEIVDDGKGIDPAVIMRKAYERGLIDEAALERMGDREAINLIFAAGLSTAEVVSDLSGRGVGMDVVRSAVQKLNGSVVVESELGKGTSIRISLPLSMAVTQVMIVESDGQLFGVPMDSVVETVRVPRSALHAIKQSLTAVLRGRIVPLKPLNALLGIPAHPLVNTDDELAVLLVQAGGQVLGLLVDGFRETIGLIQKPLSGLLSGLSAYSGSALMGDGSVLMILNIREIV